LSIVVPVFNEEESLPMLFAEINQMLITNQHPLEQDRVELIFVDDGSTDGSWQVIQQLATANPWTKALRLQGHSGKATALGCGFEVSRGEYIITLDADLQDNPAEIPRFIAKLDEGFDLVCGWKRRRKDPPSKVMPSRLFNFAINKATGLHLHDHNCGLKGCRRAAVQDLPLYGNLHRFITMFAHSRGFSLSELEVDHRARKYGRSKYGLSRFFGAFLDFLVVLFLTTNRHRTWHFFARLGIFLFSISTIVELLFLFYPLPGSKVSTNHILELIAISATILGAVSLAIGMLARTNYRNLGNLKPRPPHIRQAIGLDEQYGQTQPRP